MRDGVRWSISCIVCGMARGLGQVSVTHRLDVFHSLGIPTFGCDSPRSSGSRTAVSCALFVLRLFELRCEPLACCVIDPVVFCRCRSHIVRMRPRSTRRPMAARLEANPPTQSPPPQWIGPRPPSHDPMCVKGASHETPHQTQRRWRGGRSRQQMRCGG